METIQQIFSKFEIIPNKQLNEKKNIHGTGQAFWTRPTPGTATRHTDGAYFICDKQMSE